MQDYNISLPCYDNVAGQTPGALNYTELVNAYGNQLVDKFLFVGIIFLICSYWNRCGMQRFSTSGNSLPKSIMVALFKNNAEEYTANVNDFLDGLAGITAIISISIWIMYKLGV